MMHRLLISTLFPYTTLFRSKWSEVLDADAFSLFKEKGIFDPETALRFKTLLSKGGTEDPMELYVAFRGRDRKSTRLNSRSRGHLVCRLLLEKKKLAKLTHTN